MTRQFDIDRAFEDWLSEGPSQLPEYAVDGIVRQLNETDQRRPTWPLGRTRMNRITLAIGGMAAVLVLTLVGAGLFLSLRSNAPGVGGEPSPTAAQRPATQSPPATTATPTASPSGLAPGFPPRTPEDPRGWPDTNENPPGVYSWDGYRCAGASCVFGFMHNGYGSGDVEIRVAIVPAGLAPDGTTAVTVAGHDGIYRQLGAHLEEWIVEIEGTTISIRLTTRPGTSQADLADAHAIVGSMRYEPRDNDLGFALVFTLTTDDWDSG